MTTVNFVPELTDVETLRRAAGIACRAGDPALDLAIDTLANRLEADAKMDALIDESIDAYNRAAEAQASRAPLGSRDTAPWRDGIRAVIDVVLAEAGEGRG